MSNFKLVIKKKENITEAVSIKALDRMIVNEDKVTVRKVINTPNSTIIFAYDSLGNEYFINFYTNRIDTIKFCDNKETVAVPAHIDDFRFLPCGSLAEPIFLLGNVPSCNRSITKMVNKDIKVGDVITPPNGESVKVLAIASDNALFVETVKDIPSFGCPGSLVIRPNDDPIVKKFGLVKVNA